jgi:hypothetical protein
MATSERPTNALERTAEPCLTRPAAHWRLLVGVTLIGTVWGCAAPAPRPAAQPEVHAAPVERRVAQAAEAALRRSLRSYVGLTLQADDVVAITIADARERELALGTAVGIWQQMRAGEPRQRMPAFTVVEAVAGPAELGDAKRRMRDVLTLPGVVYLDLNETCGCIDVGIAVDTAREAVAAFARDHGVRADVVRSVASPFIRRTAGLTDDVRPTVGGLLISARYSGQCSLGLPVWSFQRSRLGFLTASHCTFGQQGGVADREWYEPDYPGVYQPDHGSIFAPRGIGHEAIDPDLVDASALEACPSGRRCRRSDAAFIDYDRDDLGILGRIARPSGRCTVAGEQCGSAMDRQTDDIRVAYGLSGVVVGSTLDKIGVTSGWTSGVLTHQCIDVNVKDTDITLLCQDQVAATSMPGDSGAPVFIHYADAGAAEFVGILWGGSDDPANPSVLLYSPIAGIEAELGGFVYNQRGVNGSFYSNGLFYTGDLRDELTVTVERNAVPAGEVEFVLALGAAVRGDKELVLAEGPGAGTGRWTLTATSTQPTSRNGLYLYQLPGGHLEFRKGSGARATEVTRVPIALLAGGTRLTFTWTKD